MRRAFGGVVVNLAGEVLLRKPAEDYLDVPWTFAKGKRESNETPEETALREVFEETGIHAKILGAIPGSFDSSRTLNRYFLMLPIEDTKSFEEETMAICWVRPEQAIELISRTRRPKKRRRDLLLLDAAMEVLKTVLGYDARLAKTRKASFAPVPARVEHAFY